MIGSSRIYQLVSYGNITLVIVAIQCVILKQSNKDQSKVKSMQISLKKNGNNLMVFKIAYTKTKYTDYHLFSFFNCFCKLTVLLCCN